MKREEKKSILLKLSLEDYMLLKEQMQSSGLDQTNYIRYLIHNNRNLCSQKVTDALQRISCVVEDILSQESENLSLNKKCEELRKGVQDLWQYLL